MCRMWRHVASDTQRASPCCLKSGRCKKNESEPFEGMAFAVFATVQRQRQSAGACVPGAVYQAPNRFRSCDACDDIKYVGQHPKSEHHTLFHVICVTGCVKFRLRVKSCSFVKLTYEFTLPGDSGSEGAAALSAAQKAGETAVAAQAGAPVSHAARGPSSPTGVSVSGRE